MEINSPASDTDGAKGARLDQMSKVLGLPAARVAALCEDAMPNELTNDWVPDVLVRRLLAKHVPRRRLTDAVPLIISAFESARDSAKPDWQTMGLPVLKNRLRLLTDGKFDEADYGFPNLHYFARQFPELIEVRSGEPHAIAKFVGDLPGEKPVVRPDRSNVQSSQPERSHVRADLWQATMDYSSGQTYVWQTDTGRAEMGEASSTGLLFPTVAQSELREWRQSFIASLGNDLALTELDRLTGWNDRGGPTPLLPLMYRGLWNGFVRDRVVERASDFFVLNELDVPPDVVQSSSGERRKTSRAQTDSLRQRIHALIDALTEDELRLVNVPASAVVRIARISES